MIGTIGSFGLGRSFIDLATHTLSTILDNSVRDYNTVYENILWVRNTFTISPETFKETFVWANAHDRADIQIYALFTHIASKCYPGLKHTAETFSFDASEVVLAPSDKTSVRNLIGILNNHITHVGYTTRKNGRHSYQALFDAAFGALDSWIIDDFDKACSYVSKSMISFALLDIPLFEAYIPLYFSAFVALQLAPFNHSELLDIAEFHMQRLAKIENMQWARNFTDHLQKRMNEICNRYPAEK